jgi:hypothetical protein
MTPGRRASMSTDMNVRMLLQIVQHSAKHTSQNTNLIVADGCKYQRRTLSTSKILTWDLSITFTTALLALTAWTSTSIIGIISQQRSKQQQQEDLQAPVPIKEPTMSIRVLLKAKPVMIIGHDKSVFAQYLLGSKTWIGPKGQRPLLPKSERDGYMLSAFVSRELGFGRTLTADELRKNKYRATNWEDLHRSPSFK